MKIRLSEVIAYNKTPEAQNIVAMFGVQPYAEPRYLALQLDKLIVRKQEQVLALLAKIHPHKDLILAFNKNKNTSSFTSDLLNDIIDEPEVVQTPIINTAKQNPAPAIFNEPAKDDKILKYSLMAMIGLVAGMVIFNNRS